MRRAGLAAAAVAVAVALAGGEAARGELAAARGGVATAPGEVAARVDTAAACPANVDSHNHRLCNSTLASVTAREWSRRVAAARRYAATRPGIVAFAVRTPTRVRGVALDRSFASASVVKAMLLVAYARHARGRALTANERGLLAPMIRRSDDAAANAIFVRVGTAGLARLARAADMTHFTPAAPIWGNARITARDQTRFFLRIDRLLPKRHRSYAMRLLRTIVPSQRWGIGQLELPDWRVHFKGGWGSGTGRIDHQVAQLTRGDERLAVAVLTAGNGSHPVGKQTLEGVFRHLLAGLE